MEVFAEIALHSQDIVNKCFIPKPGSFQGWRVVLRKEVRGRRVLPDNNSEEELRMFHMGRNEDFKGLRPDREVGEQEVPTAATGENVILDPIVRPNRGRRVWRGARGRGRGGTGGTRGTIPRPATVEEDLGVSSEEDERDEEERLYRGDIDSGIRGQRRGRADDSIRGSRNLRRRQETEANSTSTENSNSEGEASTSTTTSSQSSSAHLDNNTDEEVSSFCL